MGERSIGIGIVADDMTGAMDTAAQFVRAGWETELQLQQLSGADVVAATTDSRASRAPEAAAAVAHAVGRFRESGAARLYKKIDSTLRGQLRAEVDAAAAGWIDGAVAIVCPAFPAAGRTVVGGHLLVHGVKVSETAMAADPVTPVRESHIPAALDGRLVQRRPGESSSTFAQRISDAGPVVVLDAATEEDLALVASAVALLGSRAIPVGSAGLARHLATFWKDAGAKSASNQTWCEPTTGIAIVLVSSTHDVARRQITALTASGALYHELAWADVLDAAAWERWCTELETQVGALGSGTVLLASPRQLGGPQNAPLVSMRLAEVVARIINAGMRHQIAGVVVTGGDGARALTVTLQVEAIRLCAEVLDGVALGVIRGGLADGLRIITKAGAFGDEQTLVRAVEMLSRRRTG